MICLMCNATIDDCWRWCPECGGTVADLRPGVPDAEWPDLQVRRDAGYTVDWTLIPETAGAPQ